MTRSVDEINLGEWNNLGSTVPFPQYSKDIEIKWTDNDGVQHVRQTTVTFPNILQNVPLRRLGQYMEEIILQELRLQYGIDTED